MMPFIVIVMQLCSSGWCVHSQNIVEAANVEACNQWAHDQYLGSTSTGTNVLVKCVEMPGWTVIKPSK